MMRLWLRWTLLMGLGLLLGACLVQFLVVHPTRMAIYLSICFIILFAILLILARPFRGPQRIAGIVASVVAFAAGWYVMTSVIMERQDHRPIPELTREADDPGAGHTAVVYLTHGEPPVYDPISWVNQMNEFDEQGIAFVPFMARPFFFKALRDSYLRVGKSEHREKSMAMLASLEQAYRRSGDTDTRFYMGFLDDNPRVPAAVINALNDGASRLIVSEVFVTVSSHTEEGKHQIEEVNPQAYGVEVRYTGPVWDSTAMHRTFVTRVNDNRGETDKAKVGVLLVAHGQPVEWDEFWPLQTEQEMLYADRILELLEADGYRRENLGKAWMSFRTPKPAAEVERIFANGVEKLLFLSYTIAAAGMHSQYDIPALVYKARVPEEFPIIDLGAWGNDPMVIAALKEKIDSQIQADLVSSAARP